MPPSNGYIATALDAHFLQEARGVAILPPLLPGAPMPLARPGIEVANELAGRNLLRYLVRRQVGTFTGGTTRETFVTLTPYAPVDAIRWLNLPAPTVRRTHVLFLDPARIPLIIGPMWVAWGRGIQYILPEGFPADAIIVPGAPGGRWEIEIT